MIRCKHYYKDRITSKYKSYMKIRDPWAKCFRCVKCGERMHQVDVDKINHYIDKLNNVSIRTIPYLDEIRDDIVETDMPIDGQYTNMKRES